MDVALHHGAPIVVFDVALPSLSWHTALLTEALLLEVADCVVICVGHQILDLLILHVLLEFIHQARAVATYLLRRRHGQERYLGECLRRVPTVTNPRDHLTLILTQIS